MPRKPAKTITEKHDKVIAIKNDYDTHKIINAFKTLGCQLYMNGEKMSLHFPKHLNKIQRNELRLAFHKDREGLFKVLRPEMDKQFKLAPDSEIVRVV